MCKNVFDILGLYFVIGVVISLWVTAKYCANQTDEEKYDENPSLLVGWTMTTIFWPIVIGVFIYHTIKNTLNKNK